MAQERNPAAYDGADLLQNLRSALSLDGFRSGGGEAILHPYRADERPVRVRLGEETLVVAEVEDRWYSPGETFFRVRVANGDRYVLRHLEAQDTWSLEAFRSGAN